jgi:heptosyltransferase-2
VGGNKILVIRGGALGDFILTLPVFSALKAQFPKTELSLLAYPQFAEVARHAGLVDEFLPIESRPLASFFARNGDLDPDLCSWFKSFSIIVSYLYDPDEIFRNNLKRCTAAQIIQATHRPDENDPKEAPRVFLQALERLAIFEAETTPRLNFKNVHKSDVIALHPGSGSEKKNWPVKKWLDLVKELLKSTPANFLIVLGEAEYPQEMHWQLQTSDRVQVMARKPLLSVAHELARCRCFVGHDSGITHLAAALGLPIVVLWGGSNFEIWKPQTERLIQIRNSEGIGSIGINEVSQAIQATFGGSSRTHGMDSF